MRGSGKYLTPFPNAVTQVSANYTSGTILIDADSEKAALKYMPCKTSPITDVAINLGVTGTVTGINFTLQIETDSANTPSGTVLGAATAEFAGPAATGWTSLLALGTNTGNLTINVPVWIVLQRTSGSSLSGSNYVALRGRSNGAWVLPGKVLRHYNGTNWTTTSASDTRGSFVVKHSDGLYAGDPQFEATSSPTSGADIYSTNKQGVRYSVPFKHRLSGIALYLVKSGTPADLVVSIYQRDWLLTSETIPAASIISQWVHSYWLTTPVWIDANEEVNIIFSQSGTSDSNDYDLRVTSVSSADYVECIWPATWGFLYGTASLPSGLTLNNLNLPHVFPMIDDITDYAMVNVINGRKRRR